MNTTSRVMYNLNHGIVLNVSMENLDFVAYIVIGEPDLDQIPNIVPAKEYEKYANLHVANVASPDEAYDQLSEITFNMYSNDAVVFFCLDQACYTNLLNEMGHSLISKQLN